MSPPRTACDGLVSASRNHFPAARGIERNHQTTSATARSCLSASPAGSGALNSLPSTAQTSNGSARGWSSPFVGPRPTRMASVARLAFRSVGRSGARARPSISGLPLLGSKTGRFFVASIVMGKSPLSHCRRKLSAWSFASVSRLSGSILTATQAIAYARASPRAPSRQECRSERRPGTRATRCWRGASETGSCSSATRPGRFCDRNQSPSVCLREQAALRPGSRGELTLRRCSLKDEKPLDIATSLSVLIAPSRKPKRLGPRRIGGEGAQ